MDGISETVYPDTSLDSRGGLKGRQGARAVMLAEAKGPSALRKLEERKKLNHSLHNENLILTHQWGK